MINRRPNYINILCEKESDKILVILGLAAIETCLTEPIKDKSGNLFCYYVVDYDHIYIFTEILFKINQSK